MLPCHCTKSFHDAKLVVLTGGPGAGKTAVLEVVRRNFCKHVAVLPEAASILFQGGFPRRSTDPALRGAQRAIYRVQRELERVTVEEGESAVILCDRGTVDGLAYWPGSPAELWADLGSSIEAEIARYSAVIHLRTPEALGGYNHQNPARVETAMEARAIDDRIVAAWATHPRRVFVESQTDFVAKLENAIQLVKAEVPPCCRAHPVPELARPSSPTDR